MNKSNENNRKILINKNPILNKKIKVKFVCETKISRE